MSWTSKALRKIYNASGNQKEKGPIKTRKESLLIY